MCDEWRAGKKSVNPYTGRKIVEGGRTFIKFEKKCYSICERFNREHEKGIYINPYTMRPIQKDGDTYKLIAAQCLQK